MAEKSNPAGQAVSLRAEHNQAFALQLPIVVPDARNDGGRIGGRAVCPPVPLYRLIHHRLVLIATVFELTARYGNPSYPIARPIFQWCSRFGALPVILAVGRWQEWETLQQSVSVGRKLPDCRLGFPTPKLVDYLDVGWRGRGDLDPVRNGLFLLQNNVLRKEWRADRVDPLEPHDFSILP